MAFTISNFREAIAKQHGIARPNLFEVIVTSPPDTVKDKFADFRFQCKMATIPPSTMGVIEVSYFGRMIKIPGNRTFDNLSLTVINDEDYTIRNAIEKWMALMNSHANNIQEVEDVKDLFCGITISHFGVTDFPTGSWNFINCFPVSLGEISLDWGSNDTAEEFSVDFAYDYWTSAASS